MAAEGRLCPRPAPCRASEGATKDLDIDWQDDEEEFLEALIEAVDHDTDDFFAFAIERTHAPEDRLGGSHRFRVSASLAERPFETFLLDVAFRGDEAIATETLSTEDLLAFAGIAPVEVEVVALELQVAEKLHAYTRTYEGTRPSTRAKDLVDLALIAEFSRPDAASLRGSIEATFARRDTHPLPSRVPLPPAEWAPQFRRLAEEVGAPSELAAGHAEAAALLEPVLSGLRKGVWEPRRRRWAATESNS